LGPSRRALDHQQPDLRWKIRWRDKIFDGVHEPLIYEFTFAKAQAILAERASTRNGAATHPTSSLRPAPLRKVRQGVHRHERKRQRRRYHYYACTGRQKYGPKACDGERLPREKIEHAVIHQLASLYRDEQRNRDLAASRQTRCSNSA